MPVFPSVRYCICSPLSIELWSTPRYCANISEVEPYSVSYGTMFRLSNGVTMSDKPVEPGDRLERARSADRHVRADAQRNIDALLQAALEVFAFSGVDAPVREIAEKAGVGIGTVYRHFPQRADLVAAVFRREIDACADAAPLLAAQNSPGDALAKWIHRYTAFIATKRGLAAA